MFGTREAHRYAALVLISVGGIVLSHWWTIVAG
jgi:hypothetical protein